MLTLEPSGWLHLRLQTTNVLHPVLTTLAVRPIEVEERRVRLPVNRAWHSLPMLPPRA
jgi:hypothetical protein